MRFKFLSGDVNWREYGGKFVSKRLNNGEFDYWLVISVTNMHDATGDESGDKYHVQIEAVSPESAGRHNLDHALESLGLSDDVLEYHRYDPLFQVEALFGYGIAAILWQKSGNNIRQLLKAARHESRKIEMLFGFYMDRSENGIGQTGWDLIRGQDVSEFLSIR